MTERERSLPKFESRLLRRPRVTPLWKNLVLLAGVIALIIYLGRI